MKVETTRFGVLEIDDSSVIRMPRGPLGFEDTKDYCLIQHRPDTCFRWLQSIEEPGLAFAVIDPSEFFTDYEIELTDAEVEKLHLHSAEDALVLVIACLEGQGREMSVNLAAPVVVNSKDLVGLQVVLQDNRYSVKHPLMEQLTRACERDTRSNPEPVEARAA